MASPNPLLRSNPLVHVPLVILSMVFLLPMVWLFTASLQPREQVGRVPPELLPRQFYIVSEGQKLYVTPPQQVGLERLLVVPEAGPNRGEQLLVGPQAYEGGQLTQAVRVADRLEDKQFAARLVRRVAASEVTVKEWLLSKYTEQVPRTFHVPADQIQTEIKPVTGNYAEAIKTLTSGENDKARPISELLGKSIYPWTGPGAVDRTITLLTYLSNTLLVALLGVIGMVLSSALVAYGLSRVQWKGREGLFNLTLSTMMVPFPVLMIPLYSVFRSLGWIGTLMPLWVPAFFGGAFNIFLLRQFFLTIPSELSEAARIDGCSELQIFWRIILPLARPALSVVALFHFLFVWNDFLGPFIFLSQPETFTMALGLQQYQAQNGGSEPHLLMAASALLVLPIIVLFFFAQKTFIQGISTTGMGGR
ncbi:MAG TPA: carbohydrate ABC transporter permease [Polyangiaceae bacterium]|nr:carbohydrate ABC transporter permease [Polyangiaceae bacterium]